MRRPRARRRAAGISRGTPDYLSAVVIWKRTMFGPRWLACGCHMRGGRTVGPDILGVDEETLRQLAPHQIALLVLRAFHRDPQHRIHRGNLTNRYALTATDGSGAARDPQRVVELLMEGFHWLDRNDYIMPWPGNEMDGCWTLTRRGLVAKPELNVIPAGAFPMALLHDVIADAAYAAFVQGKFDHSITAAFREVEILVRRTGRLPGDLVGSKLMTEAFKADGGSLALTRVDRAEQVAEMQLFAGSVAYFRNPSAHREAVTDPGRAFDALLLASHLYKIVERRPGELAEVGRPRT